MTAVLVVDDDPHLRELAGAYLRRAGFEVVCAAGAPEALAALEGRRADLVLLDVMMPGTDGWQLCARIRADWDLPILMLTARGTTLDKVRGFGLGADDYLVKPFAPPELIARVRALCKRYQLASSSVVEAGRLRLDRQRFAVEGPAGPLTLPRKEFELLFVLAGQPGRTFSREQIIEQVWGYDYAGDERTVDVHVKRLRDRFPAAEAGCRIRTIRGLGYRLEVEP